MWVRGEEIGEGEGGKCYYCVFRNDPMSLDTYIPRYYLWERMGGRNETVL